MYPGVERRDFERNRSEAVMTYTDWNSHHWERAGVCDFSLGGIRFESRMRLQPGKDIFVRIEDNLSDIIGNAPPNAPMRAEVIWCRESAKKDIQVFEIGAIYTERFWEKSYDPDVTHIDPEMWEVSCIDSIRPTFDTFFDKPVFHFMGTHMTYTELDQYANRFANMLMLNSFKKGDVVAISLPNMPEYIIAWLGTLKAGCVVSGVSPQLSTSEMEYQLRDSNAKGLVTLDAAFAGRVINIEQNLPNLKLMVTTGMGDSLPGIRRTFGRLTGKIPRGKVLPIKGKIVLKFKKVIKSNTYSAMYPDVHVTPDDIACIHYTAGTTAFPKGVMLTHRNAVSEILILDAWLKWEKGKHVVLSGLPFFHSSGMLLNLYCIYKGLAQILIPDTQNTHHICAEIGKYRPAVLAHTASLYKELINSRKFKALDHSTLVTCISSAAPFQKESAQALESIVGSGKLLEIYGMTETGSLTTANPVQGKKKPGSVGLPLLNMDIKLVDPDTGRNVRIGEPGEIWIKGPQVMKGYYNKPEETDHAIDADGFIHTGDMAVFDEQGYLYIIGRLNS